jgi:hypothetical protein
MEVTRMAVKTKLQLIVEQLRLATAELKADNDKAELQQQQEDYDQYLVDTAPITQDDLFDLTEHQAFENYYKENSKYE